MLFNPLAFPERIEFLLVINLGFSEGQRVQYKTVRPGPTQLTLHIKLLSYGDHSECLFQERDFEEHRRQS